MGAIVIDPKGDRGMRGRSAGRPWPREDPSSSGRQGRGIQPLRSRQRHRDRRQGSGGGALHRAALPAPGSALPGSRGAHAPEGSELEVTLHRIVQHLDPEALEVWRVNCRSPRRRRRTPTWIRSLRVSAATWRASAIDWRSSTSPTLARGSIRSARAPCEFDRRDREDAPRWSIQPRDRQPAVAHPDAGAAIVQDLQATVAALQGRPIRTLVVIDEFSAVAAEQVVRLFGRARSAGFSLVLGTQEPSIQGCPVGEAARAGHGQPLRADRRPAGGPASTELIASLAGTRGAWRTSRNGDGRTTRKAAPAKACRSERGDEARTRLGRRDRADQRWQCTYRSHFLLSHS